ncbi:energy transducer TonB [Shewanella sp. WXL01]|uniref:energy transducer TonB n=1 Tax=Shewanella sp. WXL01 TaxID=2709721 RepID=UPI0014383DA2|nr:energy transducer TonB [Shewanella sp. WXL01]NKF51536.1 energy transducer TonB [Shewanella sp. WXL01]
MPYKLLLALSMTSALSTFAFAESNDLPSSPSLSEVYGLYQQAVVDKDATQALVLARQAHEIGLSSLNEMDITLAYLKMNLANLLISEQQDIDQVEPLFEQSLAIYRHVHKDDAIELIDPLLALGEATKDSKLAKVLFDEALDITEDAGNPVLHANVLMAAFNSLVNTRYYSRSVSRYPSKALVIYEQHVPENAEARIEATFLAAKVKQAHGDLKDAAEHFDVVIKSVKGLGYTHPYELASHAQLVSVYEQLGKREVATQHCLAIGAMQPWDMNQDQLPLHRVHPDYPLSYAQRSKEGWVQMELVIDENGFVRDITIEDSHGGSKFEKEAIKAVKQWRYAPKFENGKAVSATTRTRLDYTLSRS